MIQCNFSSRFSEDRKDAKFGKGMSMREDQTIMGNDALYSEVLHIYFMYTHSIATILLLIIVLFYS
jgi:hypothetical protein